VKTIHDAFDILVDVLSDVFLQKVYLELHPTLERKVNEPSHDKLDLFESGNTVTYHPLAQFEVEGDPRNGRPSEENALRPLHEFAEIKVNEERRLGQFINYRHGREGHRHWVYLR
jgi:hypothetical protein